MFPNSIRWRLPLSYAAIALLAVLSLGIVLLTTLRSYYQQQELEYLSNNAQAIGATLAPLIEANLPTEALEAQLSSFAFLSQTQVRLLDTNGQILADSGTSQIQPQELLALSVELAVEVEADAASQTLTVSASNKDKNYTPFIVIKNLAFEGNDGINKDQEELVLKEKIAITTTNPSDLTRLAQPEAGLTNDSSLVSYMSAVGTPYGFGLDVNQPLGYGHSDQVVSRPVYNHWGNLLGYVELSNGPAYGHQVLNRVAWGWAVAGGVAVLLATAVGWVMSHQLGAPLLALTHTTARMAGGDLSARANVFRADEFGLLGQMFNHMAERVEETVITLRRFVADAAHELHTPLTALRTNLELAASEESGHRQRLLIEQAHHQLLRLERLTRDLLDLSRLEADIKHENLRPIELTPLLQETCEPYASQAEQADLFFTLDLPPETIITQGHEAQLRRAVSNLLDNALKFTPVGGRIRVGLRPLSGAKQFKLWVEDTGIGIPVDELPQLFQPFHRGRNVAAYPGSGLGLAIVKVIVERHGGRVTAENTSDGAKFTIVLPVRS